MKNLITLSLFLTIMTSAHAAVSNDVRQAVEKIMIVMTDAYNDQKQAAL